MRPKAGIWAIGLCGSLLANLALVTGLVAGMKPDDVSPQKPRKSLLDIQALQLDRTQANEQDPDTPKAEQTTPESPEMGAGHIPAQKAPIAIPEPRKAARQQTNAERISPDKPNIAAQPPAKPEPADLRPVPAMANPIAEHTAGTVGLPAVQPQSAPRANAIKPDQDALSPAASRGSAVASSSAQPTPLPNSRTTSEKVATAPAVADEITASLAFSTGSGGEVDPVSLAAFQNFVRPDLDPETVKSMRDEISNVFAKVSCARIQASFDPETASLRLVGHIPDNSQRRPILAALQSQMGNDIAVADRLRILPQPQCGSLAGIAQIGLPQSTDQITNPLLIGADTQVRVLDFIKNDRLFFDVTAPDYDAYIYVDFFDADGNVIHLSPNVHVPLRKANAKSVFQVGAKSAADDGLQILISPPYGQEIAVAFAASAPLYSASRPQTEPALPYLDWLRQQVEKTRAETPAFKGEWVYFLISTSER